MARKEDLAIIAMTGLKRGTAVGKMEKVAMAIVPNPQLILFGMNHATDVSLK